MSYNLTENHVTPNLLTPTSHALSVSSLNSTKFMEWTNDDALELIEQYRSHTELWNRADPKYKDKLCRFRAWSEIAERFGCSKAEVERKMNVLLTQYRREKHKMLVKLYQGIQPNPSKWYAFKRFDFMEAGGGSSASLLVTNSTINTNTTTSSLTVGGSTNGHQAAVAAAAALNGLTAGFEPVSRVGTSGNGLGSLHHHRRIKSKELKYFGAMGLNLPMLLANSQTLDSWSSAGQYSPPIDRGLTSNATTSSVSVSTNVTTNPMRVPIPTITAFTTTPSHSHELTSIGTRSLFGGSSNNSEPNASPHKAMDTLDMDETKEENNNNNAALQEQRLQESPTPGQDRSVGNSTPILGSGGGTTTIDTNFAASTSPIANVNTNEAHLHATHPALRQLPHHPHSAHTPHPPHTHNLTGSRQLRDTDDLEIKQELVDYFHGAPPPIPGGGAGSQRSYSSAEELRNSADEYAQDLRVAAAKGLEFGNFVLPRNLRPPRSSPTESLEEKYTPLNMRKLNATSSSVAAAAGNVLMSSLLSTESLSEDNTHNSGRLKRSASQEAAAAAAIYAESLTNRDDCDFVGSNVTLKLRAMDRTQRIIAEKLISEVLFYGQFNELERSARIQPK